MTVTRMPEHPLIWVDTETTGLMAPADGLLLEVAVVVTSPRLDEIASRSAVIGWPATMLDTTLDDWSRQQHTDSGLVAECVAANDIPDPNRLGDVEADLVRWVSCFGPTEYRSPMCGSSVGFDRAWLRCHMPVLEARFHYRNIDVSTISELARRWYGLERPERIARHRVLDDIRDSIDLLRHWRDTGFVGFVPPASGRSEGGAVESVLSRLAEAHRAF